MGEQIINVQDDDESLKRFIGHLLNDITCLEKMLEEGHIEKAPIRIGAEQEFCLLNDQFRPSDRALEVLEKINDPHFTTELAKYNLEINLDPLPLGANSFSEMEGELKRLLEKANKIAEENDIHLILTGILPTISKKELELDYLTPYPRYYALNDRMTALRGGDFKLNIRGNDELSIKHNSVLFEACNTSFQTHLQINPDDFVSSYNWAQAIAGPILSVCTNSPLLLGRELWKETRIALFQQSIDTRQSSYALKDQQARVSFGRRWAKNSIVDIFKEDISRFQVIMTCDIAKGSMEALEDDEMPKLKALNLHNGTVYRWNRPCYGVANGKAHVRIENRYLPSGPSVIDEIANFAFWTGLMLGRPKEFDDMPSIMDFSDAKANFLKASRYGKESVLHWMGEKISARNLLLNKLIPIARTGLEKAGLNNDEIHRYLEIIELRALKKTGAQWMIENYRIGQQQLKKDDALQSLIRAMWENQQQGLPIHKWPNIKPELIQENRHSTLVGHIMSTQLITTREIDLADLAARIMEWNNIHHMPVEDKQGQICGLLTYRHINKLKELEIDHSMLNVSDIMITKVTTVTTKTTIKEAIDIMKSNEFGCLPVVEGHEMVGIITIKDVLPFDED